MQWRVDGADKHDGREVTLIVHADNGMQAEEIARNRNVMISGCRKATPADLEQEKAVAVAKQESYPDTAFAATFLRNAGGALVWIGGFALLIGLAVLLTSLNTPENAGLAPGAALCVTDGFFGAIIGAIIYGMGHLIDAARQIAINTAGHL